MDLSGKKTSEYKALSVEETLKLLETSMDGLAGPEINQRLKTFGFNEITKKREIR